MAIIGALGVFVLAVAVLLVGGITLWSGWRALRDELRPGFITRPPGARSLSLTALGVVLPVLMIVAFTLYTALALLQVAIGAFQ